MVLPKLWGSKPMSSTNYDLPTVENNSQKIFSFLRGWGLGFVLFFSLSSIIAISEKLFPTNLTKMYAIEIYCLLIFILWITQILLSRKIWENNKFYAVGISTSPLFCVLVILCLYFIISGIALR